MQTQKTSVTNQWVVVTFAMCVIALAHNMSGYALFDPDEGRNAEVAREMAESGDYILPHINGLPYLDKPTLYFAVGAASMRILGPNVVAARLPSLLFTLATVAIVAWFARRIFGTGAGWTAAITTAATPFTLAYARIVIFDSTLTFFVVLALMSFYLAVEERLEDGAGVLRHGSNTEGYGGKGEGWTAIAWVAIAFGVLTKGPIAILLPMLVAVPFALRYRAPRALADPVSLLLFGAIVAPWVTAVSLRIPDFLEYSLVTETARRFSTSELGRTGPFWYFLAIFPAAALPWSLVLVGAGFDFVRQHRLEKRVDRRILFLLLWIFVPLVFFTLSQSKRPQYVLPMIPAVALFIAAVWHDGSKSLPGARWGAAGIATLGIFFVGASRVIPAMVPANTEIAAAIPGTAAALGVVCLAASILAWFAFRRRELLLLAFSLPVVAIPFVSHRLMREIGEERSAELLAEAIANTTGSSVQVVGIGAYPPSLPFYLRKTMIVTTSDGSELTSNYLIRHIHEYRGFGSPLRRPDWWQDALLSCSEPTVFVISSEDRESAEALSHLSLIAYTHKYAAYGPCGEATLARAER